MQQILALMQDFRSFYLVVAAVTFLSKGFFKQRSCNLKKVMSQQRVSRLRTLFTLTSETSPLAKSPIPYKFILLLRIVTEWISSAFFLIKFLQEKFVQTVRIKVPLAVLSLFRQLKKVQQAFPGATLPKLSQALASFPAMPSSLPLRCFSAQIQRKILTKITNEISTCCKPGREVVERNLVTLRQLLLEKELDSYILIQDQTILILAPPPSPHPSNAPTR